MPGRLRHLCSLARRYRNLWHRRVFRRQRKHEMEYGCVGGIVYNVVTLVLRRGTLPAAVGGFWVCPLRGRIPLAFCELSLMGSARAI